MNPEKERLCRAVDEFAAEMKERLLEKYDEGFRGWENPSLTDGIIHLRLYRKAFKVRVSCDDNPPPSQKDLIDIANFAMVLRRKL